MCKSCLSIFINMVVTTMLVFFLFVLRPLFSDILVHRHEYWGHSKIHLGLRMIWDCLK
uniref:Uncharacterized protein n=1 Tax=Anguilla anguilla TaxID=7936 RepID=A0A0E9TVQ4_ANGAN